jgi:hypothetical protein
MKTYTDQPFAAKFPRLGVYSTLPFMCGFLWTVPALGAPAPNEQAAPLPAVLILAHPVLMTLTLLLALWVGWQGMNRARATLFGQKTTFNWKIHTRWGLAVMGLWLAGAVGGSMVSGMLHGILDPNGLHGATAPFMLALILFGGLTGLYMDRKKAKRYFLPILHGAANLLLLLLGVSQLITGLIILSRLFQA